MPPNSGSIYNNYKKFFSVVLIAIVGPDYKFLMVDIGSYGSDNDSAIFNNTAFYQMMETNELNLPPDESLPGTDGRIHIPYYFIGDDAFGLKTYLMKPFPRVSLNTDACKVFNYRLSRSRRVVENAFGILANRWRIFHQKIFSSPAKVDKMVHAACILHNYLTKETEPIAREILDIPQDVEIPLGALRRLERARTGNRSRQRAIDVRQYLAQYFMTPNAGEVDWQYGLAYVRSKSCYDLITRTARIQHEETKILKKLIYYTK